MVEKISLFPHLPKPPGLEIKFKLKRVPPLFFFESKVFAAEIWPKFQLDGSLRGWAGNPRPGLRKFDKGKAEGLPQPAASELPDDGDQAAGEA